MVLEPGAEPVGYLEKYRDSATDTHPWKAFYYVPGVKDAYGNRAVTVLGFFWERNQGNTACLLGGKWAAVSAIVSAAR